MGDQFPTEALAFLGAVAAFLLLLVVFFLYLNKKLCFSECGGFPCIEKRTKKEPKNSKLGTAYNYEEQDTSSDSDDEVLRRYQQSIQRTPSQRSVRSAKSQKSTVSKTSGKPGHQRDEKPSDQDKLMSMAEKGGKDGVSSAYSSGGDSSDNEGRAPSVGKKVPGGLSEAHAILSSPDSKRQQETYDNAGFSTEAGKDLPISRSASRSPENISHTSTEQALSGFGDTPSVSLGDQDEHLFDVSDLQDHEPIFISKCGTLEVTFSYDNVKGRMTVTIHHCREIPSKDRGGANNTQVRMLLLPTKKVRHKTKIKAGDNPEFQETFVLKVPADEVNNMGVRFRLYGCERMRRERMIGESVVGFASLNPDTPTTHSLTLEPRSNLSHGDSKFDVSSLSRSDSGSSTQSMQHGGMPELLSGLAYNGTTGRLSVEVIKGSNFKNMAMNRAPDTYVKLTLMSPTGQEIARSKTSVRRGQPNPLYKETFMFQVALFQLPDVTLMVSVYNKRSMKRKEMIGWFSCGYSNSSEEELAHWTDMRESKGEQVCRWHVLLEP